MQHISGRGLVFLHGGGTVIEKRLRDGEMLRVDSGSVLAFSTSIRMDIEWVGGIRKALFGGEGMFFSTLQGPG